MTIDIKEIRQLKELTGVGLTDAKRALEDSNGDFDKALAAMRKKGLTKAEKRSAREARAGLIGTYNHDGRIGVLVEVNCETDFVARNELFKTLVKDLAMHIAASAPLYVDTEAMPTKEKERLHAELTDKAKSEGKPTDHLENIVEGQLEKYYEEHCLLKQPFVKNPDQTVKGLVADYAARLGENIVVRRFERMAIGEVV
jgi:elongation factor Ts